MKTFLVWLDDNCEAALIKLILGFTSVVIFCQVIARYVFQSSLSWSEEICRYLFVWLIYLGISYAVKLDRHIRMDSLIALNILPDAGKKAVCLLSDFIFLAFAVIIAGVGYSVAALIAHRGQITAATELPMWLVYAAVPVGYALCTFRLLRRILYRLRHLGDDFTVFSRPQGNLAAGESKEGARP